MHFSTENYSVALDYFHQALRDTQLPDHPGKFRILVDISDCHRLKGEYAEAERFLVLARQLLPEPAPEVDRGKLEFRAGYIQVGRGNVEEAERLAFSAYRRLRDSNEHTEVAGVQTLIGHCHVRAGRLAEAEDFFTDALSSFRRADDGIGIAYGYNSLGVLHKNACRWNRALASLSKSLDITKAIGNTQHLIRVNLNLGVVYAKMRRFADAVSSFDAAVAGAERFGDQLYLTKALLMTGRTLVACGDLAKAERALLRGRSMAEDLGYRRELALADEYLGELMTARGDLRCAMANLKAALAAARKLAPEGDVVAECLRRIADVHYLRNRPQRALDTIEEGVRIAEACGEVYELGYFHRTRGLCHLRLGDRETAIASLETSIEAFERYRNPYEKARSEQLLGRVYARCGRVDMQGCLLKAKDMLSRSINGFARLDESSATRARMVSYVLLANVEQRLGNLDDALLSVYEADRLADEEGDRKFQRALQALRNRIESRLSRSTTRVADQFAALGGIQTGDCSRDQLVEGIEETLELILDRLGAQAGFVALPPKNGKGLCIAGRKGFKSSQAKDIESWYSRQSDRDALVITDLENHPDTETLRGGLSNPTGTLLLQRLGMEGECLGVLCVHRYDEAARGPLGPDALHFVAAYASLISLSIYDLLCSEKRNRQRSRARPSKGFQSFVTENDEMIRLLNLAERVAGSRATVLLQGETGTGKGLIAYAIHLLSDRRERSFVHVNCAALPEQLLESELFGHARGSFTGAVADKDGLLHEADGGTIFLDEIGKTSLAMQGKLLQFLDTKQVRKVGSNDFKRVDVRIVCASKTNLLQMCSEGRFLEDFFYRINDFPLTIPPLRERPEDIALLMHHYIDKISREMKRPIRGVSQEFFARMQAYRWPGNVRELEKVVRRAIILADKNETLGVAHISPELLETPSRAAATDEPRTLRERIERVEHDEIQTALRRYSGNKSKTAIRLGISYPSLLSKIKRYNLQ